MTDHALDRRLLLQAAALSPALLAPALTSNPARAAATGKPLMVIAELVAKPDHADALRALLVPFVEGARHEPGCEHYTLMEDIHTPGRFLTYEIWANEAALAAHMHSPAVKAAGPKLAGIFAKPPAQTMLKTLSTS